MRSNLSPPSELADVSIVTAPLSRIERVHALITKDLPLPCKYRPHDLVAIGTGDEQRVRRRILPHLRTMLRAYQRSGQDLVVVSAYRSFAFQRVVFESFVRQEKARGLSEDQALRAANRYSALPGHSEHQLGTTIDVSVPELHYRLEADLERLPAGKWLLAHAHHFGFVFSYPRGKEHLTGYTYEPWHLRWIGPEHSTTLHEQQYLEPDNPITTSGYLERLRSRCLRNNPTT